MPERTCVGCRRPAPKSTLVRLVRAERSVVVDPRQVAPGRGAYLHQGCAARAVKTRALARALRAGEVPSQRWAELVDEVDATASAWAKQVADP